MGVRYMRSCAAVYIQYMFLESMAMGYSRSAISCVVVANAVFASLLIATYDGGEWNPGYVFVHST